MENNKEKSNPIFLIIIFVIIILGVIFLPKIYNYINTKDIKKVVNKENKKEEKVEELDSDILEDLHFPLMRTSSYNKDTYYSLDTFKISNMSNQDILYNAYLDVYEGNMTGNGYYGCTNDSKQFNQKYLDFRVKNILGKDVKYNFESFNVPEDSNNNYKGTWVYDASGQRFIYSGLCSSNKSNTTYLNLEQFIKAEEKDDDIIVYYYVGFAKIEGDSYIIYKDPAMNEEITKGSGISNINDVYKKLNNKNKKIYKYTFKNTICSYSEYCLYEGKWVNEL